MGYFSNGTEGERYQAQYCSRCVHDDPDKGCEIWGAHVVYLSDSKNQPSVGGVLNMLIPMEGTTNLQCKLFYPAPATERLEGL